MPYMGVPSSSHHHGGQRQEQGWGSNDRDIRTLRHFGAGTARGVFRPHVNPRGRRRPQQQQRVKEEEDEDVDAELRRAARESGLGLSSSSSSSGGSEEEEGGDSDSESSSSSQSSSSCSSEEEDEEAAAAMDVVEVDPESLPAHVPRPLWRFPDDWSREDVGPIQHGLLLQRYAV